MANIMQVKDYSKKNFGNDVEELMKLDNALGLTRKYIEVNNNETLTISEPRCLLLIQYTSSSMDMDVASFRGNHLDLLSKKSPITYNSDIENDFCIFVQNGKLVAKNTLGAARSLQILSISLE